MTCSADVVPFPLLPEARLRVALRQLDAALDEQRAAVAALRLELARLSDAVNGLASSAAELQCQFDSAAADAALAREAARVLSVTAATMERMT